MNVYFLLHFYACALCQESENTNQNIENISIQIPFSVFYILIYKINEKEELVTRFTKEVMRETDYTYTI